MKLKDIFDIKYGNRKYHNKSNLLSGKIPLASSKETNNGIHGYYDIEPKYKQCITVPTTGSICEASYHNYPMDADDNTLVLVSKKSLTDIEGIYYIHVIKANKFKYFYGRQVTPERLNETTIPDTIPDWVYDIDIEKIKEDVKVKLNYKRDDRSIYPENTKLFKVPDLFNIVRGKGPSLREAKEKSGDIPYITRTRLNNGVACYTSIKAEHEGNCLTIAQGGTVGSTFYQPKPFNAYGVNVLTPKFELTENRAMYLIPVFESNKFKFNFNRELNQERLEKIAILLPEKNGDVDWEYIDNLVEELRK